MPPEKPPVPFTLRRPVHWSLAAGSQTSNLISESDDGRAMPSTRQNGTVTRTPPTVAGAATTVADEIVVASGFTAASPAQSDAACAVEASVGDAEREHQSRDDHGSSPNETIARNAAKQILQRIM